MVKRRRTTSNKCHENERVEVLRAVAKCFCYRNTEPDIAKYYAREVVKILVAAGLVDATLPLRVPETGLTPPT